jgi:homoserine O-acetyltransferase
VQGPYELFDLRVFTLEEGPTLRGCRLAYATFEELNVARDNGILVTTWYSGTHQIFAGAYIGSEHALDPEKYFIVVENQIGTKFFITTSHLVHRNLRSDSSNL